MAGTADQPYLGQIMMVAFDFAPPGWMMCDGRLLQIDETTDALFELIGTTYGGDGQATFALPDLRGRSPVGEGSSIGGFQFQIGELEGTEAVTLLVNQIPAHAHSYAPDAGAAQPTTDRPQGAYPAVGGYYDTSPAAGTAMASFASDAAGGGQPHTNIQPYLGVNFIIAVGGDGQIFPSRD